LHCHRDEARFHFRGGEVPSVVWISSCAVQSMSLPRTAHTGCSILSRDRSQWVIS